MNKLYRVLAVALAFVMTVSLGLGISVPAYADDDDIFTPGYETDNDIQLTDDGGHEDDEPPIVGDGYHLETDLKIVSLGTVERGSTSPYVDIAIRNRSTRDVSLIWQEADPFNVFQIDAPGSYLKVTDSTHFHMTANTSAPAGNYSGTLLVADQSDPGFANGLRIELSVTIQEAAPYVTSVKVIPGNVDVSSGSGIQFVADVQGGNCPSSAVSWSISGQNSANTRINGTGLMQIDQAETSKAITVTATSIVSPSVSGTARVNITNTDHTLSVIADPLEGGNVNGGGAVSHGGSMTVLAAPNISYEFVGWYVNGNQVSTQSKYTQGNITSDMTLVAKFKKTDCYVKVDANQHDAGVITSSQFVPTGGSLTLQATPKNGWAFVCWQENSKTISKDVKFTLSNITSNRTIVAVFERTAFDVTLAPSSTDCGKVTGAGSYKRGSNVKIKAEAYDGHVFKNWTLNGNEVSRDAEYIIKDIKQDYSLIANFEKKNAKTYTITAGVCTNDGVISPNGKSKVAQGASVLYTITPKPGFKILAVAVDGIQVGPVTSYTFSNVKADHSIAAAFTPIEVKPANNDKKTDNSKNKNKQEEQEKQVVTDTVTPEELNDPDKQHIMDDIVDDSVIEEEYVNYDELEGVLQDINMTLEDLSEARDYINGEEVMMKAVREGLLQVSVYDEFDMGSNTGASGDFIHNASFPNLSEVVDSMLSMQDAGDILSGNPVKINVNLFNNSGYISEVEKSAIDTYVDKGMTVGNYFEIILLKSKDGNCETIEETNVGLKVCMTVPEDLRADGRNFTIVRSHMMPDGSFQMAMLKDEDDNPNTITFTTDKFSAYGIAYTGGASKDMSKIIVIALAAVAAVLCIVIAFAVGRTMSAPKKRKHRR